MAQGDTPEPDWYAILGVNPSASQGEIRSAYRRLAGDYHPDRLQGVSAAVRALAEEKLKEINVAYGILSDARQRSAYDERLRAGREAPNPPASEQESGYEQPNTPPPPPPGGASTSEVDRDLWEPDSSGQRRGRRLELIVATVLFAAIGVAWFSGKETGSPTGSSVVRPEPGTISVPPRGSTTGGIVPPPLPPPPHRHYAEMSTYTDLRSDMTVTQTSSWYSFRSALSSFFGGHTSSPRVVLSRPLRIFASGQFQQGTVVTTPRGLSFSLMIPTYEPDRRRTAEEPPHLLYDRAPFRALLGRVCNIVDPISEKINSPWSDRLLKSNLQCGEPFAIGSERVLCPEQLGAGEVQFAVNDGIHGGGGRFGQAGLRGAYYIETAAADADACTKGIAKNGTSTAPDGPPGQAIPTAYDSVSSRQLTWRAVNVQLTRPLQFKASGQMQPREQSSAIAGPEGFDYRRVLSPSQSQRNLWISPDGLYIDATHLVLPTAPYQALLGRFCGPKKCSPPFPLGSSYTICPQGNDTVLELWSNQEYTVLGIESQPAVVAAIDQRAAEDHRGEYRFELTYGSAARCKAPVDK